MMENFGIPNGVDHFKLIDAGGAMVRESSARDLENRSSSLLLIGTCLCALYQAATCHRKCHGGSHVFEALAGRTYNLSVAAYNLISLGFYDEALTLIRAIGEISNLISLSVIDKNAFSEWLSSDKKTRLQKFSPAKVRKILKEKGEVLMYADKDWYSNLCEKYVHVSPDTKPNMHNESMAVAGGIYQEKGLETSLNELSTIVCFTSMLICKYFDLDDLFRDILDCIREEPQQEHSEEC